MGKKESPSDLLGWLDFKEEPFPQKRKKGRHWAIGSTGRARRRGELGVAQNGSGWPIQMQNSFYLGEPLHSGPKVRIIKITFEQDQAMPGLLLHVPLQTIRSPFWSCRVYPVFGVEWKPKGNHHFVGVQEKHVTPHRPYEGIEPLSSKNTSHLRTPVVNHFHLSSKQWAPFLMASRMTFFGTEWQLHTRSSSPRLVPSPPSSTLTVSASESQKSEVALQLTVQAAQMSNQNLKRSGEIDVCTLPHWRKSSSH